ncbi:MAG: tRNA (guanosine(46)-N7)-methyltransferase TrmB [Legionella sp. 40-6]|nr:tRNA (guanosine(46)-N7)-methyltransferase TrmB [Legionella sp.]OJY35265.1 MAG: tRNA (guanosine(46)-N7)-methyltransferase TrmB [Legionella sp. 40-6]
MHRRIKSYVLRTGRVSNRQQQGLDLWIKDYNLPLSDKPWDFTEIFGRSGDVIVEIGFGMGASLLTMAQQQPDCNFLGIEVHQAGVGSLAADLHDHQIKNVRIIAQDAVQILQTQIPDESLAGIQIFFPDPWPKKRHHKRRLIQTEFVHLLTLKLKKSGFIHCATDWQEYAVHMLEVLSTNRSLKNLSPQEDGYIPRPETRPLTKFEQRGTRLGHGVWDLLFIKEEQHD